MIVIKGKRIGRKREYTITPDPIYGNIEVARLTNILMKDGKKSVAYNKVILPALKLIKTKYNEDACEILSTAIKNARPTVELRKLSASSHYQVPCAINDNRSYSMALRSIAKVARKKGDKSAAQRLCEILWNTANERGEVMDYKQNMQRTAEANTAFKSF